ncbi:hypothetical protein [Pseudoduganella namucuonensis]|uniref:Uncharacterized protein n=1 Tax=Pseudoduganella namucuonensis TaxID=1035707 RepID=A0A1I7JH47_9BURK|nr:hypothetical protein [Pseudoduganella namucuonensis]SFU84486.1 hypothetical protein SAMN05216552_1011134 [Pseudoduganella namucuonensis]
MTIRQFLLQRPGLDRAGTRVVAGPALRIRRAGIVFMVATVLLAIVFGGDGPAEASGGTDAPLVAAARLAAALAWLGSLAYLADTVGGKPERVRVLRADGSSQMADVYGASDIADGHTREVKARFYHYTGEPAWLTGNGYEKMPITRTGARLATP